MAKMIKKISVKNVFGTIANKDNGETTDLIEVLGICIDTEKVTTQYGDATKFKGSFKATNCETGEQFESSTLYLPDIAADELKMAMSSGAQQVQFATRISVQHSVTTDEKGNMSYDYQYACENLLPKSEENDPLLALENAIASGNVPKIVLKGVKKGKTKKK